MPQARRARGDMLERLTEREFAGPPPFPQQGLAADARTRLPQMRQYLVMLVAAAAFGFSIGWVPARAAERIVPATRRAVAAYARVLQHANPAMPNWQSTSLARRVLNNAARWRIDPNILVAIVTVESSWHTHAVSSAGAVGLGQLMPGTAAALGVNPNDPAQNLAGAAKYLSDLVRKFKHHPNHYELAFAAYNAGPKAVSEYGGIPPYYETQHYVVKVLRAWERLQRTIHVAALLRPVIPRGIDVDYWLDAETH